MYSTLAFMGLRIGLVRCEEGEMKKWDVKLDSNRKEGPTRDLAC